MTATGNSVLYNQDVNKLKIFLQENVNIGSLKSQKIQRIIEKAEGPQSPKKTLEPILYSSPLSGSNWSRRYSTLTDEATASTSANLTPCKTIKESLDKETEIMEVIIEEDNIIQAKQKPKLVENKEVDVSDKKINLKQERETENSKINKSEKQRICSENTEGFLMIKPLSGEVEKAKDISKKSKIIDLEVSLFPKTLVDFASLLDGNDIKKNLERLIEFIINNKGPSFYPERPKQEILCSITFKAEDSSILAKLLKKVSERLKEEPLSLQIKYKNEINDIEVIYSKIFSPSHSDPKPIALTFKEKDMLKLIQNITKLSGEECFISSKDSLKSALRFLTKKSELFQYESRVANGIQINYITLPKLLEKVLEISKSSDFENLLIYTHEFYISSLNLLIYLIYKYFTLPDFSQSSDLYRSKILKLIQFWIQERAPDFTENHHLQLALGTFLNMIHSQQSLINETTNKAYNSVFCAFKNVTCTCEMTKNYFPKTTTLEDKEMLHDKLCKFSSNNDCSSNLEIDSLRRATTASDEEILLGYQILTQKTVEEIAKELTIIDWEIFASVNIRELVKKRWTERDRTKCPTYWKYVNRFNNFSFWLQYTVLSLNSSSTQLNLIKKLLEIALLCKRKYKNYYTSHYMFSALLTLQNLGIFSFEDNLGEQFQELRDLYASSESMASLYEKIFRNITEPSIPNLNFFLRIFLRLQDGVVFQVELEENKNKYLNFAILEKITEYCNEFRRFQKFCYHNETRNNKELYQYLKSGFEDDLVGINLDDSTRLMEILITLSKKQKEEKVKKFKFSDFFNWNVFNDKS